MTKILKFGGTSVGSADNMRRVARIIQDEKSTITVLSAMSGVTDALIKISHAAESRNVEQLETVTSLLSDKYTQCITSLLTSNRQAAIEKLESTLALIACQADNFQSEISERIILAQGELLTTAVFTLFMQESGIRTVLLNAPDFMITDAAGQINTSLLKEKLALLLTDRDTYYITQGFVCTNNQGRIDNLGRGGSDYSAALMGVAIDAGCIQIWTDIDGMHNNDPRIVSNTRPIRQMSFDEAAELAYFGAKILHPATIQPCKDHSIPVLLKNTMDPAAEGTEISNAELQKEGFHAVAAKDGIIAIRITSTRMLLAYGFLRKVFEIFEQHKTPIDMITTSEVAVSLTIDNDAHLPEIEAALHDFGIINVERDNTIVCVVGQCGHGQCGMAAHIFSSLCQTPIKMISYGASNRSVAILIDTKHKKTTLQSLTDGLFE